MSHSLSCLHWAANHCGKQSHQWPNLFCFRFIISDLKIASEIAGNLIIFLQQVCFSTFFSFLKLPKFLSVLSLSWWHCLFYLRIYEVSSFLTTKLSIFVFTFCPIAMEEMSFLLPRIGSPLRLKVSSTLVQGLCSLCHLLSFLLSTFLPQLLQSIKCSFTSNF